MPMTMLGEIASLRVVIVAEDITRLSGGAPAVVKQLSQRVSALGARVQLVHALGAEDLSPAIEDFACPPRGLGKLWCWGPRLRERIWDLSKHQRGAAPIFHLHGVWAAPQYFAARYARARDVPFVLTAHGMLEPWLWSQQGWKVALKKRAYWRAMAYPALRRASVIHAITPLERSHLRELFPENRIEVIPNAIDVPPLEGRNEDRIRTILFLGRIEPKKGVDILIRAVASANLEKEWRVLVAGPAWSDTYVAELEGMTRKLGLADRVHFMGPVFGEQKRKLLATAWVMAVPSHSEVIGLVNLEAAAACLPSITTPQTGLHDWEEGGGILVQPNVETLAGALRVACAWTPEERSRRGLSSRQLVQERYSWDAVLPMWLRLYSSMRR